MKITLGITSKLMILFFFFIFIFYGTLLVLFVNVQKLMETSQQIVSINNQVAALSKGMLESLINMDVNDKKFRLLKKEVYRDYFETAKKEFCEELDQIIKIDASEHQISSKWKSIHESFKTHVNSSIPATSSDPLSAWAEVNWIDDWTTAISIARKENQQQIEHALIKMNNLGRQSVKNSLIGLGVSIFAGVLGAGFISKSMIRPLKKLKSGLKNISNDNDYNVIKIDSNDEFSELAAAFNDMSRQLKEDEDIRSDFIATLSHEIRTPLSSIQESVNMIIEEVLGPVNNQQKKFLEIASSEISRISELFNHLLDVSMLESDSGKLTSAPMDPNQLIQEASKGLISNEKINHVDIRLHELCNAPMVMGVKNQILQVLSNIIGNAVKFSYKDSFVDIYVLNEKNKDVVTFKISDQGPGIPEQEQPLIFKKYYRAKSVRNHMAGVGLGLNISKRIIHAHRGTIFMENNKEKGCSFFFTLPKAG
ncbi:MAG: HAMP domain-containing histidine kinase [Proteobacteria bacterium]|nr:HAMP domain-containing histidine kinase [Pseudomonadota bacterium]MBU1586016.1 HAMP domain-containing histidine kinase [Pseudomonadota bacterium]MBU2454255.1 HAMP domain-containing histidine kinase [Pseudomonadota bacterium]